MLWPPGLAASGNAALEILYSGESVEVPGGKAPSQHAPSSMCHILWCHLTPFFVGGDNLWPWAMLLLQEGRGDRHVCCRLLLAEPPETGSPATVSLSVVFLLNRSAGISEKDVFL